VRASIKAVCSGHKSAPIGQGSELPKARFTQRSKISSSSRVRCNVARFVMQDHSPIRVDRTRDPLPCQCSLHGGLGYPQSYRNLALRRTVEPHDVHQAPMSLSDRDRAAPSDLHWRFQHPSDHHRRNGDAQATWQGDRTAPSGGGLERSDGHDQSRARSGVASLRASDAHAAGTGRAHTGVSSAQAAVTDHWLLRSRAEVWVGRGARVPSRAPPVIVLCIPLGWNVSSMSRGLGQLLRPVLHVRRVPHTTIDTFAKAGRES
jgi:hypothetical protein